MSFLWLEPTIVSLCKPSTIKKNLDAAEKLASAWASLRYVRFTICRCLIFVSVFESHLQGFNAVSRSSCTLKPTRGIKDVNKDNSLVETAQQEHGEQRFKHNQLKEQCVFICYILGVRSLAKTRAAGEGEGLGRRWRDRRCPGPLSSHPFPFCFSLSAWNRSGQESSSFPTWDSDPAETGQQIQMCTFAGSFANIAHGEATTAPKREMQSKTMTSNVCGHCVGF